jgi:hypothetical protein
MAGKVASLRELTGWLTTETGPLEAVIADPLGCYRRYALRCGRCPASGRCSPG